MANFYYWEEVMHKLMHKTPTIKVVVIEMGAGLIIPSIRNHSDGELRINSRQSDHVYSWPMLLHCFWGQQVVLRHN